MTDAPERIWAEPDGSEIIIHNGAPDLKGLIATGYLHEYIRADTVQALVEAAREGRVALAKTYAVVDWPADGDCDEDRAILSLDAALSPFTEGEGR